jgi:membrane-associated protein
MGFIARLLDIAVHLDRHLSSVIAQYGLWTYLILFFVIFLETGFVVTPFLPGDSLLFAAGTFAALGALDPVLLVVLLSLAAVLGDTANYWIGKAVGPKVFRREDSRFFKKEYLDRTHDFYEKHGAITIVIARFIPIIRTFAPFVAGVGRMSYFRFLVYNVTGGVGWVLIFVLAGYFFGNIPFIRKNFSLAIMAIVLISLCPALFEAWRRRRKAGRPAA